jgi:hypothetical protein
MRVVKFPTPLQKSAPLLYLALFQSNEITIFNKILNLVRVPIKARCDCRFTHKYYAKMVISESENAKHCVFKD